jgi:outer membrane protein TolC
VKIGKIFRREEYRRNDLILPLVFSVFLGGCVQIHRDVARSSGDSWTPPPREERAKREQFRKDSSAGIVSSLSAPWVAPDAELDLPMLEDIAFENSPTTKKSWQAARIAAAQAGKAASIFFPRVVIGGIVEKAEGNTLQTRSHTVTFYPTVEAQCSIFQFGGHTKSAETARQLLYAANYQHNRALQTLAHDVQRCYFILDSAESAVEASQRNLNDALTAYDAAFVKNQTGLSNIQDYLQAKANRSRAEFELENAKALVELARANLAKVIGVEICGGLRIARSNEEDSIGDFEVNIEKLIFETMQTRQDILAAHSIVAAKKNALWATSSKLLPELVIGGSGSRKFYRHNHGSFDNFTIYASLRWTVFDGLNNIYDMIEAKARVKQAEQDLKQLKLTVASEVWAKYHAFKSAIKQLSAARNYEQSAQESFDSIVISYKNGLSSFNDLMSAQTQLSSARQRTVDSKNNLSLTIVDLAYMVGIENFIGKSDAQK